MKRTIGIAAAAAFCGLVGAFAEAATVVEVTGVGAEKVSVSVNVANKAYASCLKRNLEISGLFTVAASGSVKVSGTAGGTVTAVDSSTGRAVSNSDPATDDKSARMAARALADAMCEAFGRQKGFACDKIAFVNRKGSDNAELCMCYPDGFDIRQLTSDAKASVGPRWKDASTLFYTGFLKAGPQVYELDVNSGRRRLRWSFKGLTTGAAVAPDGNRVAIILSFQGNPELYVIDMNQNKWQRMTVTPSASEGQPAWSPDGRRIVYVSDETRHPQLYVIDVATKAKRRLTSRGGQNVDPDWGPDGRIAYITKRGGAQVAVMDPAAGESSARLVTDPGNWEHPSWSRNGRHLSASRDKALFIVDSQDGGDKPRQVFSANGNWITPSWRR